MKKYNTPSIIEFQKLWNVWRTNTKRQPKILESFILKVEKQAYKQGKVEGYTQGFNKAYLERSDDVAKAYKAGRKSILDEYKAEQAKLLKGFKKGLPLESQLAIKKFYKGDKHD